MRVVSVALLAALLLAAHPNPQDAAVIEYTLVVGESLVAKPGLPFADRWGIVINGTTPGPQLEATEGDEMIITVINDLAASGRSTSLHWHGMFQPGTPYSDGVPGVSSCPIPPGSSDVYRFIATPAGTHWYHGHSGTQYVDGALGALIVKPAADAQASAQAWESEIDREEVLLIQEWAEKDGSYEHAALVAGQKLGGTVNVNNKTYMLADVAWPSWLANGEARKVYNVSKGETVRFRFIHGGANYRVMLSVAGHSMRLVMTDPGTEVEPTDLDIIDAQIGERYDFLVTASHTPGVYPIYISDSVGYSHATPAVLVVEPAVVFQTTSLASLMNTTYEPTLSSDDMVVLNGTMNNYSFPSPVHAVHMPDTTAETIKLTLTGTDSPYAWGVNNTSLAEPSVPVYLSGGAFGFDPAMTQIIKIAKGDVVDIELINPTMMDHPFHIHGHQFWVIGSSTSGKGLVINTQKAQPRDTVGVPAMGKAVVRLQANNPGPWIFHCHIDLHLVSGMAVVLQVGELSDWPAPPSGLAVCGSSPRDFLELYSNPWSAQFIFSASSFDDSMASMGMSGQQGMPSMSNSRSANVRAGDSMSGKSMKMRGRRMLEESSA
mmetsp:Transcript_34687/g.98288  ORF Transcript_34687/g.98288 Transcript_34687/m.98288 type:complete len:603 (-) Transcript_34687:219-2027(-)|eukprot:CAMPEP_0117681842 /NCGR_PEP_ID=MMETSP0804-20121206/19243_1 /TAXON_ID=1074897 /ORGANISM="Tetraselmis astigmatica, Strain CCMP880" /LENGTH=602 /DNA_ID=CAMNT_0005491717 /DNA_START=144 /DNA_END=1952 /DNA_ORIENTATION=+